MKVREDPKAHGPILPPPPSKPGEKEPGSPYGGRVKALALGLLLALTLPLSPGLPRPLRPRLPPQGGFREGFWAGLGFWGLHLVWLPQSFAQNFGPWGAVPFLPLVLVKALSFGLLFALTPNAPMRLGGGFSWSGSRSKENSPSPGGFWATPWWRPRAASSPPGAGSTSSPSSSSSWPMAFGRGGLGSSSFGPSSGSFPSPRRTPRARPFWSRGTSTP